MLMCDKCGMWRLVYANRKLKAAEICKLRGTLDDLSFSCGADLHEDRLPPETRWSGVRGKRCTVMNRSRDLLFC